MQFTTYLNAEILTNRNWKSWLWDVSGVWVVIGIKREGAWVMVGLSGMDLQGVWIVRFCYAWREGVTWVLVVWVVMEGHELWVVIGGYAWRRVGWAFLFLVCSWWRKGEVGGQAGGFWLMSGQCPLSLLGWPIGFPMNYQNLLLVHYSWVFRSSSASVNLSQHDILLSILVWMPTYLIWHMILGHGSIIPIPNHLFLHLYLLVTLTDVFSLKWWLHSIICHAFMHYQMQDISSWNSWKWTIYLGV